MRISCTSLTVNSIQSFRASTSAFLSFGSSSVLSSALFGFGAGTLNASSDQVTGARRAGGIPAVVVVSSIVFASPCCSFISVATAASTSAVSDPVTGFSKANLDFPEGLLRDPYADTAAAAAAAATAPGDGGDIPDCNQAFPEPGAEVNPNADSAEGDTGDPLTPYAASASNAVSTACDASVCPRSTRDAFFSWVLASSRVKWASSSVTSLGARSVCLGSLNPSSSCSSNSSSSSSPMSSLSNCTSSSSSLSSSSSSIAVSRRDIAR